MGTATIIPNLEPENYNLESILLIAHCKSNNFRNTTFISKFMKRKSPPNVVSHIELEVPKHFDFETFILEVKLDIGTLF